MNKPGEEVVISAYNYAPHLTRSTMVILQVSADNTEENHNEQTRWLAFEDVQSTKEDNMEKLGEEVVISKVISIWKSTV